MSRPKKEIIKLKKVYKVTFAMEDKDGYAARMEDAIVLATTGEEATEIARAELGFKVGKKYEEYFVDGLENLAVIDFEE